MRAICRDEAVRIDAETTRRFGIPSLLLMECAGVAVARVAASEAEANKSVKVVVIAGPGNNGADGLVAARHLANRGALGVEALLCGSPDEIQRQSTDARLQGEIVSRLGIEVTRIESLADVAEAVRRLSGRGVFVIDALFGIGLRRPLEGRDLAMVGEIDRLGLRTLSVDVPSGLDCDTGRPLGTAVRAAVTVTFGLPKQGLLLPEARPYVGRVAVAEIGFPRPLLQLGREESQPDLRWIDFGE